MKDIKFPVTPAIHLLRKESVAFIPHIYKYEDKGGTAASSRELGVSEDIVIKTLIMEDEQKKPLIVLMHGNKKVSLKELARQIGAKMITPCQADVADRHSGYQIGGTSPFATKKKMAVFAESSIAGLDRIFINGGGKGFLIEIKPSELARVLAPTWVNVAI